MVTAHILAYSSHAYEQIPLDEATVILNIFLVSCPFYVLFCLHVLAAPSVILWRRPGPDTIVFQQYQKSIQQRNTTSLLQFKLTFLLATDYQVLHKQPRAEGGQGTFVLDFGGKPQSLASCQLQVHILNFHSCFTAV